MPLSSWSRLRNHPASRKPSRRPPRPRTRRRLELECLEARLLLAGDTLATAAAVTLTPGVPLVQTGTINPANHVDLYAVPLSAGGRLRADLRSLQQQSDNPLAFGLLRVFD